MPPPPSRHADCHDAVSLSPLRCHSAREETAFEFYVTRYEDNIDTRHAPASHYAYTRRRDISIDILRYH